MKTDDFRVDYQRKNDNVTVPAYRLQRLLADADRLKKERDQAIKDKKETLRLNEFLRDKVEQLKSEKPLHVELEEYA